MGEGLEKGRLHANEPNHLEAVQSLNSLNDQIAHFMVNRPNAMSHEEDTFLPTERDTLSQSMALMRHLLMDAQASISQDNTSTPPNPLMALSVETLSTVTLKTQSVISEGFNLNLVCTRG
ncbi:hypothetical protein QQF64_003833 [Cirrhinus molitorella]|uniref:Uncharacterized protein n=1 Tax=Cirrhinus molitorella TaxID=172907 RepID=A0ABR3MMG5_9TELE